MEESEELLAKRLAELDRRAYENGTYCFSEFLGLAEQSLLPAHPVSGLTLCGGFAGAERVVARFSPPDACWEEPYPIAFVKASPVAGKFSGELTHRDFLGALMGLGIKRSVVGDIIVSGGAGHIICLENMAPYVADNLLSVGRESMRCELLETLPEIAVPKPEVTSVVVASERMDALVAGVYGLSRSVSKELFEAERVFKNGRTAEAADDADLGDIISVRGFGRFVYRGIERETKHGRIRAAVEVYR